jgi:uncharacterized protein
MFQGEDIAGRQEQRYTGRVPQSDAPIAMDDVQRSVRESPLVALGLVEGPGHQIERVFLDGTVEKFIRCPLT